MDAASCLSFAAESAAASNFVITGNTQDDCDAMKEGDLVVNKIALVNQSKILTSQIDRFPDFALQKISMKK
jgi:hypothetical protein